jgi:ketopantoate reductase
MHDHRLTLWDSLYRDFHDVTLDPVLRQKARKFRLVSRFEALNPLNKKIHVYNAREYMPGVIRHFGPIQKRVFGEFDSQHSQRALDLLRACESAGIGASVSTDIEREIWEKFVFLVGLSATTATIRRPIGAIRSNPQTRGFLLDSMRETVSVGRALAWRFLKTMPKSVWSFAIRFRPR